MLSLEQGKKLIEIARKSISAHFKNQENQKIFGIPKTEGFRDEKFEIKEFPERKGVFVTLNSYPEKELRGCIGYPYAVLPLGKAISEAAVAAAVSDPRFEPLSKFEVDSIIIEISILTAPEEIKTPKEKILEEINIGKDGLICQYNKSSGLLLPQVATENKMNAKEFLDCVCNKAGLPQNTWKKPECKIYKFQAQIFLEKSPNGEVKEEK